MPYDREAIHLRILGHFGASASTFSDYWSTGLRLAVVGGTPPDTGGLVAFLESISGAVSSFHTNSAVAAGTNVWLDELTAAHIGLDGKYASPFTETVRRLYAPFIAGAGTPRMPWNTAHVMSVRTLKPRGVASNGRMYYPMLAAAPVDATGRLSSGAVLGRLNATKTLFDAINVAAQQASSGLRIHVMSKVGGGWSAMATAVRADQRLDSIERRENDQPASWQSVDLA